MSRKGQSPEDKRMRLADISADERFLLQEEQKRMAIGRTDPVFFGEYFLGLKFTDKQKIWLWLTTKTQIARAYELAKSIGHILPSLEELQKHPFKKNILAPCNRFGKTLVTAVKHVWMNFYKIGVVGKPSDIDKVRYGTLNLSPHSLQVDAAYRYIIDFFNDRFLYKWTDERTGETVMVRNFCRIKSFLVDHKDVKREIVFSNNTKVKGAPTGEDQASSIAGTDWFYISYDEAPQSSHLEEELPAKILSRLLDSGGPLDIIGTPEVDKPSQAYYYRICKDGMVLDNGYFTMTGGITDNKFLGREGTQDVLEAIRTTDPNKYRQVAFGEFITVGGKLFDSVAINQLWDRSLSFIPVGIPGRMYLIAIDWGYADDGDPSVIYILDITEATKHENTDKDGIIYYTIAYHEEIQGGDPYVTLARVRILQQDFCDAQMIHDSTSMGGTIISKMLRSMGMRKLHDFGMYKSPKEEMLFMLYRAMNRGRVQETSGDGKILEKASSFGKIRSPIIPKLESQFSSYKMKDKKLKQDEIMSLGMGIWFCERKYAKERSEVFELNILADKPEHILKRKSSGKERGIATRNISIKERTI